MFNMIRVTMAGIERMIPASMLKAMQSMGWKEVSGANPKVEGKTDETKPRQSSAKKKKDKV